VALKSSGISNGASVRGVAGKANRRRHQAAAGKQRNIRHHQRQHGGENVSRRWRRANHRKPAAKISEWLASKGISEMAAVKEMAKALIIRRLSYRQRQLAAASRKHQSWLAASRAWLMAMAASA
jgi:hypothetical protein